MQNQFIVTPFFLDTPRPALTDIAQDNWQHIAPQLGDGDTQARMCDIYRPLADAVEAAVKAGKRPVSVAGDCCATIPVLAGLQRAGKEVTFVWFDAHGDFNTWKTTPSGFLGGMPLAMMVGLGEQRLCEAVGLEKFPANQIVMTDARDLDPGEKILVEQSGMTHFEDVAALLEFDFGNRPIYVHFDVDVLNLEDLPAVSYPATGGPSAEQLRRVFQHLSQTGLVEAVSFSSWTPELDEDGAGSVLCIDLLNTLLGQKA